MIRVKAETGGGGGGAKVHYISPKKTIMDAAIEAIKSCKKYGQPSKIELREEHGKNS